MSKNCRRVRSAKHQQQEGHVPLWRTPTMNIMLLNMVKMHSFMKCLFFPLQEFEDAAGLVVGTERISLKKSCGLKYWPCLLRIIAPPLEWWLLLLFWLLLQLLVPWYWAAGVTCVCRGSASPKMRGALWEKEKPKSPFFWCSTLLKDLV